MGSVRTSDPIVGGESGVLKSSFDEVTPELKLQGVGKSDAERLRGGCSKNRGHSMDFVVMVLSIQALNSVFHSKYIAVINDICY